MGIGARGLKTVTPSASTYAEGRLQSIVRAT